MITVKFIKESKFTDEEGVEVSRIRQIINESLIEYHFRFVRGYKTITRPLYKDPGPYLVVIYDRRAKFQCMNIISQIAESNLRYFGNYALIQNN